MTPSRQPLLVAPSLRGRSYAEAHSDATDEWFRQVVVEAGLTEADLALLAVGGYGRRELCPYSDIDVVLVHGPDVDSSMAAEALWYPAWDRGLKLGYAVVTMDQARVLLREEFEWATSFLDARLIAGAQYLCDGIEELTAKRWSSGNNELMTQLAEVVRARHVSRGDVAFHIEPDLKEGRGGLRDIHAMGWASGAVPGFADDGLDELEDDIEALLAARVELHRLAGRAGDVLRLDDQDDVAESLEDADGQALMLRLAHAGRRIGWYSDEVWRRWASQRNRTSISDSRWPSFKRLRSKGLNLARRRSDEHSPSEARSKGRRSSELDGRGLASIGLASDGDLLSIVEGYEANNDPLLVLRLAATAAQNDLVMDRQDLAALRDTAASIPEPWPAEARRLFSELLLSGRPAIRVVEDLAQFGLMERLVQEWAAVLCRPQRNVLHTFTVDRHLCEAAVNASALVGRVARPDLLVVGALLHDIGKGFPGDHTEVGMKIIVEIGERMGYPEEDIAILVDLCRHHLLLPDVATRRDLSDPGTIAAVAAAVDSTEFLNLLAALTEADSLATGPSAWGSWKERLLHELVDRTTHVLEGGNPEELITAEFPDDEVRTLIALEQRTIKGKGDKFTVVVPEQLGIFSTMAGVLAVSGLEVIDASAYSEELDDSIVDGEDLSASTLSQRENQRTKQRTQLMAASQFTIQRPQSGPPDWERVEALADEALEGQVALSARLEDRASEYSRYRRRLSADPPIRKVYVDNEISEDATVVEVHGPDEVGLLYRLTNVLRELQLDIRTAKIQTFGPQAVDSFYVRNSSGEKVTDNAVIDELQAALNDVLGAMDTGNE